VRHLSIFSFDPCQLGKALWLIFSKLAVVAAIVLFMVCAAYTAYLRDPSFTRLFRNISIDHLIVFEQVRRALQGPPPDVAFVGDSSCLMGIDVPLLTKWNPKRSVESYCTLAYLGPAGYAALVDKLNSFSAKPKALVIVFHPIQFQRESAWDSWLPYLKVQLPVGPDLGFPLAALDYIRFVWLSPLLYRPLPGAFGEFYGSATALVAFIRDHHGSALDPGTALNYASLEAFRRQSFSLQYAAPGNSYRYDSNHLFDEALPVLAASISRLDIPTFLMISPIPNSRFGASSQTERADALRKIAQALGIPESHIIKSPGSLPNEYFSSETHLNRWGRILFTERLKDRLPLE
jgi:hypothetical protein